MACVTVTPGTIVPGKIVTYLEGWVAPSWISPPPVPKAITGIYKQAIDDYHAQLQRQLFTSKVKATRSEVDGLRNIVTGIDPGVKNSQPYQPYTYHAVNIRGEAIGSKKPSTIATFTGALKSVYTSEVLSKNFPNNLYFESEEDTMNHGYSGNDQCCAPEAPETVKQARARLKRDVKGAKAALKRFDANQKAQRKTQAEYKAKVAQREADRELALTTIRELTNHRHAGPVRIDAAQKLLNL